MESFIVFINVTMWNTVLFLHYTYEFLGAFVKLRKATISFVMPVRLSLCPSFRMEQLSSHWKDFSES
jgi:hypothetical protein